MITELHIQNYKSHEDTRLELKPLTILTGVNGSGKSSIIQSLLLLRQSYKGKQLDKNLSLNGAFCEIGTGKDAIFQSAKDDFIQFSIKIDDKKKYTWKYASNENKDYLPVFEKVQQTYLDLETLPLFNTNFQYLSAGRLPELKFEREDVLVENERQISQRKGYGELVAQFLYYYGEKEKVNGALLNANSSFNDLIHQVTAWEREINPKVNVLPQKTGDSYTVYYSFDRSASLGSTDPLKSENVAFGLNYALPIITALLAAKPGSLLLIENPEAHLHPRGQSKLSELIALAAQNGVQVIIETHSDHIFNGVLKAVSAGKIKKGSVKVDFLELDETNRSASKEIQFSDKGRILNPQKGFFDQFDDDLDTLLGL
jgi:predicted ATPase